jgi:hypothetical protein
VCLYCRPPSFLSFKFYFNIPLHCVDCRNCLSLRLRSLALWRRVDCNRVQISDEPVAFILEFSQKVEEVGSFTQAITVLIYNREASSSNLRQHKYPEVFSGFIPSLWNSTLN